MKSTERIRLLRTYGRFYIPHHYHKNPDTRGDCYYCGEFSTQIDHCPPIAHVEDHTITDWKLMNVDFLTVRCCGECNRMLGDKAFYTVEERLNFLERQLTKEYEKALTLWTDEELEEMSPQFRKSIIAKQQEKIILLNRINHLQWRQLQLKDEFPLLY